MSLSFSSQGSTAGNPQKGLLGNNSGSGSLPWLAYNKNTPPQSSNPAIPSPTTPVKKINNPDGSSTEFHSPDTGTGNNSKGGTTPGLLPTSSTYGKMTGVLAPTSSSTPTGDNVQNGIDLTKYSSSMATQGLGANGQPLTPPASPNTPPVTANGTPAVGTTTQNAQNVLDQSNLNNNPEYQALATQDNALVKASGVASQSPYSGQNQSVGQSVADIGRPQSTGNLAGELGNLNNQISQGLSGNAAEAGRLISGATLATGGAENVLGASTYSPTTQGQAPFSGLNGYGTGSSQYGDPTNPATGVNVQTIKTNQNAINTINSAAPAADAAFGVLNSYAQGIGADTPITSGIAQLYGSTAQGNAAVAGFKAQLQSVRNAWDSIEGGGSSTAIPDNVTPAQLTQIQQQLKTDAANKITGYQNENASLSNQGSSSSSTSGSSTGGNSTSGWGWNG